MFEIQNNKTFMDTVHGYINIPCCFVDQIIDTEMFQRLRNIDQTGMRILYPDAKHDRFGHSLGVYFLGTKAVDALLNNFKSDIKNKWWNVVSDRSNTLFWAKNKLLFLLACLLHDIGHAPFSHALEDEILNNSEVNGDLFTELLADKLNELESWEESESGVKNIEILDSKKISAAAHEQLGAYLVLTEFINEIKTIYEDLATNKYPYLDTEDNGLFAEYYDPAIVIDTDDFNRDVCFIARMILGQKYAGFEPDKQIRNCFIELLNGDLDVDKLDYIMRDTQMSGISNTAIDVERLLGAISIITKTTYRDFSGSFVSHKSYSTIQRINNNDAVKKTTEISGVIKGTLVLQPGVIATIQGKSKIASLHSYITNGEKLQSNDIIRPNMVIIDDAYFTQASKLYRNGEAVPVTNGENRFPREADNREMSYTCINAEIENNYHFKFQVGNNPIKIDVNGYFNISIEGGFFSESTLVFFSEGKIDGYISEMDVIGNSIHDKLPDVYVYNTFSIGYKKQAINIIANVLNARDYLYLWIYAHHKVVYYANFLIPAISISLSLQEPHLLPHKLCFSELAWLDDSFLWTNIRGLCESVSDEKLKLLIKELLSRKYKTSLYKSLAEYDLLFESLTIAAKENVYTYLAGHIDDSAPFVHDYQHPSKYKAGYLSQDVLDALAKYDSDLSGIENLVFASPDYRFKAMNPQKVIIRLNDETAVILDEITLLRERSIVNVSDTKHYFYLYYNLKSGVIIDNLSGKLLAAIKRLISVSVK